MLLPAPRKPESTVTGSGAAGGGPAAFRIVSASRTLSASCLSPQASPVLPPAALLLPAAAGVTVALLRARLRGCFAATTAALVAEACSSATC